MQISGFISVGSCLNTAIENWWKTPICYQSFCSNGLCLPQLVPFYFLVSKSLSEIKITNGLLKKFIFTHISGVTCTFHSIRFLFFPSVLSTIITLLYIRSLDLIHHITGSLHPFTILSPFSTSQFLSTVTITFFTCLRLAFKLLLIITISS